MGSTIYLPSTARTAESNLSPLAYHLLRLLVMDDQSSRIPQILDVLQSVSNESGEVKHDVKRQRTREYSNGLGTPSLPHR